MREFTPIDPIDDIFDELAATIAEKQRQTICKQYEALVRLTKEVEAYIQAQTRCADMIEKLLNRLQDRDSKNKQSSELCKEAALYLNVLTGFKDDNILYWRAGKGGLKRYD